MIFVFLSMWGDFEHKLTMQAYANVNMAQCEFMHIRNHMCVSDLSKYTQVLL